MIDKERVREIDKIVRGLSDKQYEGYSFCDKLIALERKKQITYEESNAMAHIDSDRNWRVD